MKNDVIQCLNPNCRKRFKDTDETSILKTRLLKRIDGINYIVNWSRIRKYMCPYCHGTNTTNVTNPTVIDIIPNPQLITKWQKTTYKKIDNLVKWYYINNRFPHVKIYTDVNGIKTFAIPYDYYNYPESKNDIFSSGYETIFGSPKSSDIVFSSYDRFLGFILSTCLGIEVNWSNLRYIFDCQHCGFPIYAKNNRTWLCSSCQIDETKRNEERYNNKRIGLDDLKSMYQNLSILKQLKSKKIFTRISEEEETKLDAYTELRLFGQWHIQLAKDIDRLTSKNCPLCNQNITEEKDKHKFIARKTRFGFIEIYCKHCGYAPEDFDFDDREYFDFKYQTWNEYYPIGIELFKKTKKISSAKIWYAIDRISRCGEFEHNNKCYELKFNEINKRKKPCYNVLLINDFNPKDFTLRELRFIHWDNKYDITHSLRLYLLHKWFDIQSDYWHDTCDLSGNTVYLYDSQYSEKRKEHYYVLDEYERYLIELNKQIYDGLKRYRGIFIRQDLNYVWLRPKYGESWIWLEDDLKKKFIVLFNNENIHVKMDKNNEFKLTIKSDLKKCLMKMPVIEYPALQSIFVIYEKIKK